MRASFLAVVFVLLVGSNAHAQKLSDTWGVGESFVGTHEKFLIPKDDASFDHLRPSAVVGEKSLALVNRGIIVSKDRVPPEKAYSLSFTWMWTEGRESDRYHDNLAVVLRTSGAQRKEWSHEITDGVAIKLMPHQDRIVVHHYTADKAGPEAIGVGNHTFKRFEPYYVRVADDGKNVSVLVDDQIVLETKLPTGLTERKVAIYNREPVAGVRHVSVLTEVELNVAK